MTKCGCNVCRNDVRGVMPGCAWCAHDYGPWVRQGMGREWRWCKGCGKKEAK